MGSVGSAPIRSMTAPSVVRSTTGDGPGNRSGLLGSRSGSVADSDIGGTGGPQDGGGHPFHVINSVLSGDDGDSEVGGEGGSKVGGEGGARGSPARAGGPSGGARRGGGRRIFSVPRKKGEDYMETYVPSRMSKPTDDGTETGSESDGSTASNVSGRSSRSTVRQAAAVSYRPDDAAAGPAKIHGGMTGGSNLGGDLLGELNAADRAIAMEKRRAQIEEARVAKKEKAKQRKERTKQKYRDKKVKRKQRRIEKATAKEEAIAAREAAAAEEEDDEEEEEAQAWEDNPKGDIHIIAGSGLPKVDRFGSIDPYVKVTWDGYEIGKSDTKYKNQRPRFDYHVQVDFATASEDAELLIELFDEDKVGDDDFISQIILKSEDIEAWCQEAATIPHKIDLDYKPGARKKEMKLAVGQLTIFFKAAKDVDLKAMAEAAAARRQRMQAAADAKINAAREKFAI